MDFLSIKHFGDSELEENQNELIFRRKLFVKKKRKKIGKPGESNKYCVRCLIEIVEFNI